MEDIINICLKKAFNKNNNLFLSAPLLIAEDLRKELSKDNVISSLIPAESIIKKAIPSLGTTVQQAASIKLTQLDNNFNLVKDTAIEINSLFIEEILLSLHPSAFMCDITLNLPYCSNVPDEYALLFQNSPLNVELNIINDYEKDQTNPPPQQKSINTNISLQGITSSKKNTHHKFKNTQSTEGFCGREYTQINLRVVDTLQSIWDNLYPIAIYTDTNYQNLFENINNNYTNLIDLFFDSSISKILSTSKPFIMLNCDLQHNYSLYDFFISTLKDYGVSLFYDYSNTQKASKYIISDSQSFIQNLQTVSLDEETYKNIAFIKTFNSLSCNNIEQFDTDVLSSSSNTIEANTQQLWNESLQKQVKNTSSYLTQDDAQKTQIKNITNNYKSTLNDIKNNSLGQSVQITSSKAPLYNCPLLPISKINFEKYIQKIAYKQNNFPNMLMMQSSLKIKTSPLWKIFRQQTGVLNEEKQYKNNKPYLKKTSFKEEKNLLRPNLIFSYDVYQDFWLPQNVNIVLPREPKEQSKLSATAEVYTTSNDASNKTPNHMLFDTKQSQVVQPGVKSDSKDWVKETSKPNFNCSYLLKLSKTLLPKENKSEPLLIPLNINEANNMPNIYSLLKNGTYLGVNIYREYVELNKFLSYPIPEDTFASGNNVQKNCINFEYRENELISNITHSYDLSKKFANLIIQASPQNNAKIMSFDNNGIKISSIIKS